MEQAWIGCSGFQYKHWKEVFYPAGVPQRKWFEFYCEHFNTVELNVTFYRTLRLSAFEGWYQRSPESFRFAVKAPRLITHYKQFSGTESLVADFYALIREGLKDKLGPVLFQLPPRQAYRQEHLDKICNNLDPAFKNVVEFRNASWWNGGVYQQLASRGISFCSISHPALPDECVINTKLVYYRLHGTPHLYRSLYDGAKLRQIAEQISAAPHVEEAYIYFNNDIDASALQNAREMQGFLPA
ncbi:MAG: DUF72 domain-containing protein [Williamsia sp.]|nr:DUF72 domain-containing protein [Williamsia sp.]